MKRIRYKKTARKGVLESVRNIHSQKTDHMFIVYLHVDECRYVIKNIITKKTYHGGDNVNNIAVLKRNIKSRLEKLGVKFAIEIRKEK